MTQTHFKTVWLSILWNDSDTFLNCMALNTVEWLRHIFKLCGSQYCGVTQTHF